ncbi:DUF4783 domain-containing protein [Prolixibacteraceae bacterium JC049]|nr:DUF4783 domain-containing protein [Prolixibacteraceae bacterium JC049]
MKMKQYLGIVVFFIGMCLAPSAVQAQIPDEITLSLKAGDAKTLAKYFNTNIELVIEKDEDVYSKSQAEQLIRNFFKKHKPKRFELIHNGNKGQSYYVIGKLETSTGMFRVNMLIKKQGRKTFIHQLEIETQSW